MHQVRQAWLLLCQIYKLANISMSSRVDIEPMSSRVLKTVVFMGSARDITPPWGGPSRLGNGILAWVKSELSKRSAQLGDETITHEVTVFDPLEVFGAGGALEESGAEIKYP